MNKFLSSLSFGLILVVGTQVFADLSSTTQASAPMSSLGRSDESFEYTNYYQISEDTRSARTNLLSFTQIKKKFPLPTEAYSRTEHFGTWIRDDQRCLNTRAKVLIRDSRKSVSYTSTGCSVSEGEWSDVYSGKKFAQAAEIQIDHFVPLKNAYMTGAFEWDSKKRCLYANYLGNQFHLISVSGTENLRKSDNAPNGYMPPNKKYTCQYLKQWLETKLIWSLRITPEEAKAIKDNATQAGCKAADFNVSEDELRDQRRYIADHADLCKYSSN